jgi:hypothetical protein
MFSFDIGNRYKVQRFRVQRSKVKRRTKSNSTATHCAVEKENKPLNSAGSQACPPKLEPKRRPQRRLSSALASYRGWKAGII